MGLAAHMGEDMPTRRRYWRVSIVVAATLACACRGPAKSSQADAPRTAAPDGGLVRPLQDDSSEQIVSWVDGQIVTDWASR